MNPSTLDHFEEVKNYLVSLAGFQYILVGEHSGRDDHEIESGHYHIFVQYNHCNRLSVSRLFGAHSEHCKKSPQANVYYIKCEDKKHQELGTNFRLIHEEGELKFQGGNHSVKSLMEYKDFKDLPDYKMVNTWFKLKTLESSDLNIDNWQKDIKVIYIQGPSGIGKTNKAKEIIRENREKFGNKVNIIKYQNGFYLGVGSAKMCIYDDFRSSDMKAKEFVQLIDYNKNNMNIKNGSVVNNYELIVITSVERLSEIYRNVQGEPREQWMRRIELINMYDDSESDSTLIHVEHGINELPFYN